MPRKPAYDVIIPARNEEARIGPIVRTLKRHSKICHVFVSIDRDTWDKTDLMASTNGGYPIFSLAKGKGQVINEALPYVHTMRVVLFDGDLLDIEHRHISVLTEYNHGMTIGVPDIPSNYPKEREWAWPLVSGERTLPTEMAKAANLHGYLTEVQLLNIAKETDTKIYLRRLRGLKSEYKMTPKRKEERDRDGQWGVRNGVLPRKINQSPQWLGFTDLERSRGNLFMRTQFREDVSALGHTEVTIGDQTEKPVKDGH